MAFEDLYRQDQKSKINCLFFDLDDTLYPLSSGLADKVLENIGDYMVEKLGIDRSKIADLCNLLYKNYGTTMAGLRAIGYTFNYDDYHSFVHGRLPYENLKPDPVLRHLLLSLPIRKMIFTNADKIHAVKALSKLGLEDCFEGIICFETLNSPIESESVVKENIFDIVTYLSFPNPSEELTQTPIVCKPSEYAIELALKIANVDPQRTIFFDDSVRNIQAGKLVGLQTVLVVKAESIHNIRRGTDVFKALALGASGIFIGRPVVFSLAAEGEAGVRKVLQMFCDEFELTVALSGCTSLKEITRNHIVIPSEQNHVTSRL